MEDASRDAPSSTSRPATTFASVSIRRARRIRPASHIRSGVRLDDCRADEDIVLGVMRELSPFLGQHPRAPCLSIAVGVVTVLTFEAVGLRPGGSNQRPHVQSPLSASSLPSSIWTNVPAGSPVPDRSGTARDRRSDARTHTRYRSRCAGVAHGQLPASRAPPKGRHDMRLAARNVWSRRSAAGRHFVIVISTLVFAVQNHFPACPLPR